MYTYNSLEFVKVFGLILGNVFLSLTLMLFLTQSDSEYEGSPSPSRRRRRSRRSTVRFADDMNRELHDLNSSVRDLSTDQFELRGQFNREMDRRDRCDS